MHPAVSSKTKGAENPKSTERPKAPDDLSSVAFRILTWGEIYINGKKRGIGPPLTTAKLKPGKYRIEVKNSSFPAYSQAVEVKSHDNIKLNTSSSDKGFPPMTVSRIGLFMVAGMLICFGC